MMIVMSNVFIPQVVIYQPGQNTTRNILSYLNYTPRDRTIERQKAIRLLSGISYRPGRVGIAEYIKQIKMSR